jgi:hypothetical protein
MRRLRPSPLFLPLVPGVLWALGSAAPLPAQEMEPDSATMVGELRQMQAGFEEFRRSRIPAPLRPQLGHCDERIGRICIWFGGEDEANFPPEPPETQRARGELIGQLAEANRQIRDPWVVGQLVHYLVEAGNLRAAEQVARDCDLAEGWWCSALLGYVLHLGERFVEAEPHFRDAAAAVPDREAERWRTPRFVLSRNAMQEWSAASPAERERMWELFWRLSDPLFMVEGNDRLTEHYARLVVARIREEAAIPYEMEWGEDLEESLVRYGRTMGWSRARSLPQGGVLGGGQVMDTRRVIGHHHPRSRGYLFPEEFLPAPSEVPPESWITAPREARTWYAAPYAPDFRALDTQVARFRRGDEMLVVGAYRPLPPQGIDAMAEARAEEAAYDPFDRRPRRDDPFGGGIGDEEVPDHGITDPVRTGLFLMPVEGGPPLAVEGDEPEGVFTVQVPRDRYVASLEVFDEANRRAWRARQGVSQVELPRGLVGPSDILLLREGAPIPETLEEAIPLARPGIRIKQGERFTIAWEVYGLGVDEEVQVSIGFTRGRPGFLARVGAFLGLVEADEPVEVSFTDTGPDQVQTVFRAVTLGFPDLDPGNYTLHIRLELAGREPVITSRPLVVGG